ncbi:MAG: hypothetical protein WAK31_24475 [Chthoniobacterales bacterium]
MKTWQYLIILAIVLCVIFYGMWVFAGIDQESKRVISHQQM